MGTYNTNILPNTTGLDLGSDQQRWDGFFNNLVVTGSINGAGGAADSVQVVTTTQALDFAGGVNAFILAAGGGIGGITLTLPPAASNAGRAIRIKKTDFTIGAVNVVGAIEGSGSYSLTNQYQYVVVESGNGAWWVVANN